MSTKLPSIALHHGCIPKQLEDTFLREIKALEARQRLAALVFPKRQALTRHQALLAVLEGIVLIRCVQTAL